MRKTTKTEIPETRTGRYQIGYHHTKAAETYEYCDADNIHERVAELEADEDVVNIEVDATPVPRIGIG